MDRTYYDHFFALYKHVHDVVYTIWSGKTESNDNYTIELRNSIQQILNETNEFENILLDVILNEIEQILYPLTKKNKKSYIIGILRQWVQFAPYFDIRNEQEIYWIEGNTVNANYEFYKTAKDTIRKNERILVLLKASVFEKYLFGCYQKQQQFFKLLSDFCYLLDIDFNKLQVKVATPPENTNQKEFEKTDAAKNQENETVFDKLISHVKFDKNEINKKLVKEYLNQLTVNNYFNESNDKDFATIAVIFYQSGWLTNIKSFEKWKSLFSEAFNRKNSTYKLNRLKGNTEFIKSKIPFLDKIPIKEKK